MNLGAEPKKVAILVGLLLVALVVYLTNSGPDTGDYVPPAAATSPAPTIQRTPGGPGVPAAAVRPSRTNRGRTGQEFRPSLRPARGEERADPMTIDPTLKLDLLAKLQAVNVEGPHRSIFDFGQPPAPKPDPVKVAEAKKPVPSPIVPADEEKAGKTEPSKPQAPPIPLKFYGYVSPADRPAKRAFFVEGEDIHVVHEGELVKKRYKVIRIGINSVVVEDTQFGSEQTLPLEEQQG